jgi:transposase
MFIRKKVSGSKDNPITYLQLAYSYRNKEGKPRQKILCTLGKEDDMIDKGIAASLAQKFAALSKELIVLNKNNDSITDTTILGPILVLEKMWKIMGLQNKLEQVKSENNIEFDFEKAVKLMIFNRLIDPKSKLGVIDWKNQLYSDDFQNVELNHLYRSLDFLSDNKDMLEKAMYKTNQSLFKPGVNIVFYDLTTLYFESSVSDDLRKFGYSKDNKTDCVQVVLGMLLSEDNIPLGYELFPGNTYEGHTVFSMLNKLKEKYEIKKIVMVADKGILSQKVLVEIEEAGYEYIIASKISKLPKKYHIQILDKDQYQKATDDLMISAITLDDKRVVLGHSKKRARRDKRMREQLLDRLSKKLKADKKGTITKSAYKKYLDIGKVDMAISEEKVKEQSLWDGHFGFVTNNKDLSQLQIIETYSMLYQIEASFRCIKSTLNIRPMFHWTEKRIKGHIMMCFLSFCLLRGMQKLLIDKELYLTHEKLMQSLDHIKAVKINADGQSIFARTDIKEENCRIFRALGVKIPSFILKDNVVN